jgi:hypothetical protein
MIHLPKIRNTLLRGLSSAAISLAIAVVCFLLFGILLPLLLMANEEFYLGEGLLLFGFASFGAFLSLVVFAWFSITFYSWLSPSVTKPSINESEPS